jgi:rare lipoprotein A
MTFSKRLITATMVWLAAHLPNPAVAESITATVYHPWYDGRPDYCGTTYRDSVVSAAHAWLRCGTKVMVTNPRTGKNLLVRITDRCACSSIDLSYRAAVLLGVPTDGIARVRISY